MNPGTPSGERRSLFVPALVGVCVVLVAVDVALVMRNRSLSERLFRLEHTVRAAQSEGLAAGELFPPVALLDFGGAAVHVPDPGGGSTLLLVSSSSCEYCEDVAGLWRDVARTADGTPLVVFELVLDATPQALSERSSAWPLLAPGPDSWTLVRRLPGVPAALLVGGDGKLLHASYGAQQPELSGAVAGFLDGSQR
jgi:hypothetical protein